MRKQYADNKGFWEDLTEGKFSFPVMHCVNNADEETKETLLDILKQHTKSIEIKRHALKLLERTDTFTYCRQFLETLEKEIRSEIKKHGGNYELEKLMDMLSAPVSAS